MSVIQEESTDITVRSYWPSVVASGAMLLATDALSIERTHGTFLLAECNVSPAEHFDFAYLQGSAALLLQSAMTYDAYASCGALILDTQFLPTCMPIPFYNKASIGQPVATLWPFY